MRILKTAFTSISTLTALAVLGGMPAEAAGLPQLDIATFPPQLIWLAITFAVLYILMSRVALPRVSQVLEERQHKIEDNLKKAETLRAEAQAAAEAYEKALMEARAEAHDVLLDVHNRLAEDAARKQAEVSKELETEIKAAEARIDEAKTKAMEDLSSVATEVALSASEKVSGESLNEADVAKIIAAVMEERQ